uniref:Uncharacterized protein n=1 Tax=Nelumbo nucifera TaxID=4432 RepID=A0A822XKM9_NELNU|nr:TPA_asm: hypothetical protein HUJ06_020969 [Nelumbo nucifera]
MEKTIETVRGNFNAVRTGRANPAMLDRVEVLSSFNVFIVPFVMSNLLVLIK